MLIAIWIGLEGLSTLIGVLGIFMGVCILQVMVGQMTESICSIFAFFCLGGKISGWKDSQTEELVVNIDCY
jgi:hypothetical protein